VPHHAAAQRRTVEVKAATADAETATSVIPFTAAAGLRAAHNK
jgi:hypothetical protein